MEIVLGLLGVLLVVAVGVLIYRKVRKRKPKETWTPEVLHRSERDSRPGPSITDLNQSHSPSATPVPLVRPGTTPSWEARPPTRRKQHRPATGPADPWRPDGGEPFRPHGAHRQNDGDEGNSQTSTSEPTDPGSPDS